MKTIITAALVLALGSASAQQLKQTEVPENVVTIFQQSFNNGKTKSWEKKKNGNYEVEFEFNKKDMSATFTPGGQLLNTENKMDVNSLPKATSDYIHKNYAGYTVSEATQVIENSGTVSYEVEVKKAKTELDLLFDANGNFVKQEAD